jgi:threonyl-tRNA synthetase
LQKTPFMIIIGDKEIEESSNDKIYVSVRTREGKDLGLANINDFIKYLKEKIEKYV